MQTDRLITALAADLPMRHKNPVTVLVFALLAGLAVSAAGFWITLGPRPDIATAAATVRFDLKIVEMVLLGLTACAVVSRLAVPGAAGWKSLLLLLLAPLAVIAGALIELALVPRDLWRENLVGSNSLICLVAIPLLALPMLAALLMGLRHGAATHPAITGAVAGLAAGGFAAALYAVQCTDDSPLFVVTWYTVAIAAVTLCGAALAPRILRW